MLPHRGNCKTIADLPCQFPGCGRVFKTASGITRHVRAYHDNPTNAGPSGQLATDGPAHWQGVERDSPMPDWEPLAHASSPLQLEDLRPDIAPEASAPAANSTGWRRIHHPFLTARPCDEEGVDLPEGAKPQV
ncbi:C2H2-type domain-containing protein [Mycena indigotica]|uniref:C2H2-type domain-containing protein n=1 Tax=Mycena indigotica TaxID=2126181 RepID=A0A8H6RZM2_9AGAR|nr:C2H2-type domain-containing protein [Mycena indigotica]KAF7290239.1 C2H2-type domain-containing protein [Mycena indigotica]